jgi:hypothetical protein
MIRDPPQPISVSMLFMTIGLVVFPAVTIGSDKKVYISLSLKSAVMKNRSTIQLPCHSCNRAHSISDDCAILRESQKHADATNPDFRPNIPTTNAPSQ